MRRSQLFGAGLISIACGARSSLPLGEALPTATGGQLTSGGGVPATGGLPSSGGRTGREDALGGGGLATGGASTTKLKISGVAVGDDYSCAVVNGGVRCWGGNGFGQLGNGSSDVRKDSPVPTQVEGLTAGVSAISSSYAHTCVIIDGGAYCWGLSKYGQLGGFPTRDVPVRVQGLTAGVTAIAAGWSVTCAVVNGAAVCWGADLGANSAMMSAVPVQVPGLESGVSAIAVGAAHACAVARGGVYCWGAGDWGQLGNGSFADSLLTPVPVSGLASGVTAIAAGAFFTCAFADGKVMCWGANGGIYGSDELGSDSSEIRVPLPRQAVGLTSAVSALAMGEFDGCALTSGSVQCWGVSGGSFPISPHLQNVSAFIASRRPAKVPGFTSGVTGLAVGLAHICAVVNGEVECAGDNYYGQLGDGSTTSSSFPVKVAFPN